MTATQPELFDRAATLQERFEKFLDRHRDVYYQFVQIAKDLKAAGRKRYSADGIGHVLRWQRVFAGNEEEGFKINNSFISLLARKAMSEYPELAGFFELRKLKARS